MFAKESSKAGYTTNPKYADKLISIIRKYKLEAAIPIRKDLQVMISQKRIEKILYKILFSASSLILILYGLSCGANSQDSGACAQERIASIYRTSGKYICLELSSKGAKETVFALYYNNQDTLTLSLTIARIDHKGIINFLYDEQFPGSIFGSFVLNSTPNTLAYHDIDQDGSKELIFSVSYKPSNTELYILEVDDKFTKVVKVKVEADDTLSDSFVSDVKLPCGNASIYVFSDGTVEVFGYTYPLPEPRKIAKYIFKRKGKDYKLAGIDKIDGRQDLPECQLVT